MGNILDVNVDNSTIEISSDNLRVKDLGITNDKLAGSIANAKLSNSSIEVILPAPGGLTGGGVVDLGQTVSISVDTSVLRTTGNQTIAGTETFTGDIVLSGTTQDTATILLTDTVAPSSTTNKIYSITGDLYWDGTKINQGAGSSAGIANRLAFYSTTTQRSDTTIVVSTTTTSRDTIELTKIIGVDGDFSGNFEVDGNLDVPTDTGSLRIGASQDLVLLHDATRSSITNNTGVLRIENTAASSDIELRLGDTGGATSVDIQSSAGTDLLTIDSKGIATLTGLLIVDDIWLNGNTIGIQADEDLLTLAANQLTVSGNVDVTSGLDVSGAAITAAAGITNTAGDVLVSGGKVVLLDNINLSLGDDGDLTLVHNGTNTEINSTTGNLLIDNASTTGKTLIQLGTDTSATSFEVLNDTGTSLLKVGGDGITNISNTTQATSSSAGALVVGGGIAAGSDIYAGGDLFATSYNTTSDERLKEDIKDVTTSESNSLLELSAKTFKWIDKDKGSNIQCGLIAQEVQKLIPDAVDDSKDHLSVNYQYFIGLLIKKVQDLEERLSALEVQK